MPRLKINGVIGWDITAKEFCDQLDACSGDVDIEISSPGGSVYDGLQIYNAIKNYDRGTTNGLVNAESSSIASIAMLGCTTLKLNANSAVIIHNPSNGTWGDYQVMQENADFLLRFSNMMARIYEEHTSFSYEEIKTMMDKETSFIGKDEICVFGSIVGEQTEDVEDIQAKAKMSFTAMREKVESQKVDLTQIRALKMLITAPKAESQTIQTNNKVESKVKGKDEKPMDLNQLKTEHPAVYAQAVQDGVKQENERISAHLEFMDVAPETATQAIKDGSGLTAILSAKYLKANINKGAIASMEAQNPEAVDPKDELTGQAKKEADEKDEESKIRACMESLKDEKTDKEVK